jgi:hypothetical protein
LGPALVALALALSGCGPRPTDDSLTGPPPDPVDFYHSAYQTLKQADSYGAKIERHETTIRQDDSASTGETNLITVAVAQSDQTGLRVVYSEDHTEEVIKDGVSRRTDSQIVSTYADGEQHNQVTFPQAPDQDGSSSRLRTEDQILKEYFLSALMPLSDSLVEKLSSRAITPADQAWMVELVIDGPQLTATREADWFESFTAFIDDDTVVTALIDSDGRLRRYEVATGYTFTAASDGRDYHYTRTTLWTEIQIGGVELPTDRPPTGSGTESDQPAADLTQRLGGTPYGYVSVPEGWTAQENGQQLDITDPEDLAKLSVFVTAAENRDSLEELEAYSIQFFELMEATSVTVERLDLIPGQEDSIVCADFADSSRSCDVVFRVGPDQYSLTWSSDLEQFHPGFDSDSLMRTILASFRLNQ